LNMQLLFFISLWTKAIEAANNAVHDPINVIIANVVELYSNIGDILINKYTPAVHFCWLFPLFLI